MRLSLNMQYENFMRKTDKFSIFKMYLFTYYLCEAGFYCVSLAGLILRQLPASASEELGFKAYNIIPS